LDNNENRYIFRWVGPILLLYVLILPKVIKLSTFILVWKGKLRKIMVRL